MHEPALRPLSADLPAVPGDSSATGGLFGLAMPESMPPPAPSPLFHPLARLLLLKAISDG
jgi:hypothetical protein